MKVKTCISAMIMIFSALSFSTQAATIAFECKRDLIQDQVKLMIDTDKLTYTALALDSNNNDAPIRYRGFLAERVLGADRVSYSFNHKDLNYSLFISPSNPGSARMGVVDCKQIEADAQDLRLNP